MKFKPGDRVRVKSTNLEGIVVAVENDTKKTKHDMTQVKFDLDNKESWIKVSDIELIMEGE